MDTTKARLAVEGRSLSHTYVTRGGREVPALRDVSVTIQPGESVAVVGESGSGKSTLARCLAALERPRRGYVVWNGTDVWGMPREQLRRSRRWVQIVFQNALDSFDPRWTVAQIIAEPLRTYPGACGESKERTISELLSQVALDPTLARRYAIELSGGQQQRLALARALATGSQVLLLDEPLTGLDVTAQVEILSLLARLRRERGLGLLFVTHNLALVPMVSDRVLVLQAGRVMEELPAASLDSAEHAYTRSLLAAVPRLDNHVEHRV